MSGARKFLEENYNMNSSITLEQYLRTYYNILFRLKKRKGDYN